jgi:hypothetical protein
MKQLLFVFVFMALGFGAFAQPKKAKLTTVNTPAFDATLLSGVKYRMIGPFRGGRSAAAVGSVQSRNTFYFGATGGGVWKTTDGGSNWKNIRGRTRCVVTYPKGWVVFGKVKMLVRPGRIWA